MFSLKQCLDAAFPSGPRSEVRSRGGRAGGRGGHQEEAGFSQLAPLGPPPRPFFPADHVQGEPGGECYVIDAEVLTHDVPYPRLLLHHQQLHTLTRVAL